MIKIGKLQKINTKSRKIVKNLVKIDPKYEKKSLNHRNLIKQREKTGKIAENHQKLIKNFTKMC